MVVICKRMLAAIVAAGTVFSGGVSHAEEARVGASFDTSSATVSTTAASAPGPRLHAQIEVASLILPTAGLLGQDRKPGNGADMALPLAFHFHYRADRFAIGGGASLALVALTSSAYAGTADLPRTHERGFFQIGPEGRYYFQEGGTWELWAGAKAGYVMLTDRYANGIGDTVPSNYGVKTVSVRTEGIQALAGVGAAWRMTRLFTLGLDARGGAFVFPGKTQCSPVGDCSSMNGAYPVIELGLAFGILRDI